MLEGSGFARRPKAMKHTNMNTTNTSTTSIHSAVSRRIIPSARTLWAAVLAIVMAATFLVVSPGIADASEPGITNLRVTGHHEGRLTVNFDDSTGISVDRYQIWDGSDITTVNARDARVFPGFGSVGVGFETPKEYRTQNFARVCLFVRIVAADGSGSGWSNYECATPFFFPAPEISAEATPIRGHAVIDWEDYVRAPEANTVFGTWIQIHNGHSSNWLKIQGPSRAGNSHYLNAGKNTCFKARFWNSSFGTSGWSNEICIQLN